MELEESETGHMHMTDYNSKLKMKKIRGVRIEVRHSSMMWPRYLNIDVYYPATCKYGSLCSFTAETLSTYVSSHTNHHCNLMTPLSTLNRALAHL